jgi:hypothetical protein
MKEVVFDLKRREAGLALRAMDMNHTHPVCKIGVEAVDIKPRRQFFVEHLLNSIHGPLGIRLAHSQTRMRQAMVSICNASKIR